MNLKFGRRTSHLFLFYFHIYILNQNSFYKKYVLNVYLYIKPYPKDVRELDAAVTVRKSLGTLISTTSSAPMKTIHALGASKLFHVISTHQIVETTVANVSTPTQSKVEVRRILKKTFCSIKTLFFPGRAR